MKPLTLQTRLTAWTALVVALGMILCGGAIMLGVKREQVTELDRQLRAEGQRIFTEWERHGGPAKYDLRKRRHEIHEWVSASDPPRYVEVVTDREETLFHSPDGMEVKLQGQRQDTRDIDLAGKPWRLVVMSKDGIIVRIAGDLAPVNALLRQIAATFLLSLPLLILFVALSGRWIARKALEPVKQITASAEKVTAAHLDRRVPVPAARDEIQRLASVLNSTFEQLETSFGQAMRFSADASHELKTPLTVLRTSLEALLTSPTLHEEDHPAVAGLLEQVNRITAITAGLLLLARADAGKLHLDLQPVNLCEILEDCVEDTRIVAEPQEMRITLNLPERAYVRADATRLRQILSNLLDNAVKYNVPGGSVWVNLAAEGGAWQLEVANTGVGIPPEHRPHIFKRFYRSEHFANVSGHGLGLSLASELARAHGGGLGLVRSDAEWTVFRLVVPAAQVANAITSRLAASA